MGAGSRKGVASSQAALVDHRWGICGKEQHIVHQVILCQSVQVAQVLFIRPHKSKLVLNLHCISKVTMKKAGVAKVAPQQVLFATHLHCR